MREGLDEALTASDLRKAYGAREVVRGVDLTVAPGEIVGLLGPSGSGKSTIFKMLTGVEQADGGTVSIGAQALGELGIDARARLGLSYVPQSPELFPGLSVEDTLRIAIDAQGRGNAFAGRMLATIVKGFGLEELREKRFATLSGGQRRLVEIAFAVCAAPRFLLLDEPFAGLDPLVVERICGIVRLLARSGLGILITDHKARVAFELVERAVVLDDGVVIARGAPADVVQVPHVRNVFLGDDFAL